MSGDWLYLVSRSLPRWRVPDKRGQKGQQRACLMQRSMCVNVCVHLLFNLCAHMRVCVWETVTLRSHSLHLHNSGCQRATAQGDIFSISLGKQGLSIKCVKWSGMSGGERRASFVPMWRCCARIDSLLFMRPGLSPTNQCLLGVFSPAWLKNEKCWAQSFSLLMTNSPWERRINGWGVMERQGCKGKGEVWERKAGVEGEAQGGREGSFGSFEDSSRRASAAGVLWVWQLSKFMAIDFVISGVSTGLTPGCWRITWKLFLQS